MLNKTLNISKDLVSLRDGFGQGLVVAGEEDINVVALTADLRESTKLTAFIEKFPERFFEVGVAEQILVTIASGMAACGKIPFATSYAIFSPGRNWEQIRTTICLNDVPVKIVGSHGGLNVGLDGSSHQALEDIALMRTLPNMVVIVPCDSEETKKTTLEIAKNGKPTYLRLNREKSAVFTTEKTPFQIGKAETFWEDKDPQVAIIACGPLVYDALLAAKRLKKRGIGVLVINCHTIKPIDEQAIVHAAKICEAVVTVEDHQIAGGLGSAVAEVLANNFPVPMEFVGMKDSFGESGKAKELMEKYGLNKEGIMAACKRVIARSKENQE
jgi:transketolase